METRNANSYLLSFDNTNGIALGVAVDNVATSAGNVGVIVRDDKGALLTTGSLAISANLGHSSFVLATQYPVTDGIRGTVEFDTPPGGQISVLGIRFTPPNNALTTIPALANVGTAGGSIAHIATGNGWQTTFVLLNTGTTLAPVTLKFFADLTGGPLTIPVSFPQIPGGTVSLVSIGLATAQPRGHSRDSKRRALSGSRTDRRFRPAHHHRQRRRLRHLPLQSQWPGGGGAAREPRRQQLRRGVR